MDPEPPCPPAPGAKAGAEKEARLKREAAALRDNLRKRKAQARARGPAAQPLSQPGRERKD
jgi:hypothetical protein